MSRGREAFGVWAKKRLIDLGKSQKEFGSEVGWSASEVSKVFNGSRKIKLEEFPFVAIALKVSAEELFEAMGISIRVGAKKR